MEWLKRIKDNSLMWVFGNLMIPILPILLSFFHKLIRNAWEINPGDYLNDALIALVSVSFGLLSLCINNKRITKTKPGAFALLIIIFSTFFYAVFKEDRIEPVRILALIITAGLIAYCTKLGVNISDEIDTKEKQIHEKKEEEHKQRIHNCFELLNMVSDKRYKDCFCYHEIMYCEQDKFDDVKRNIESKKVKEVDKNV